jgi:hypothetical protein
MKLKYSFLVLFIACSEVGTSEQALEVSVSPKYEIQIGVTGNSSQFDFVSSTLDESSFLILNKFLRSIDTVKVESDSGLIATGNPIPFEGPNGVEIINYFQEYNGKLAFMDNNTVYIQEEKEVDRLRINEFNTIGENGLLAIASLNSQNKVVNTIDDQRATGYFFLLDIKTRKLALAALDLVNKTTNLFDFKLSEKLEDHIILNEMNGGSITNPYYPNLLLTDNKLIVSYPFMNQIQIYSIKTGETVSDSPKTNLYKVEKDLPQPILSEIPFKEYSKISGEWQDDVLFGPIMSLGDSKYFRFVRGELEIEEGIIYLEVFDQNFEKVGEVNLSSIEPNLGLYYIPLGNKIFVKSKTQPDEEILNYYLIELN